MKNDSFQPETPPWSDELVVICSKCGKKLASKDNEDPSELLKSELKARVKEEELKHQLRVVTSSCMDLCPKDRIAVAVIRRDGHPAVDTFSVSLETSASAIWNKISKKA